MIKISLNLKKVEPLYELWYLFREGKLKGQHNHEQLAAAFQKVVDTALKNGCTTLEMVSGGAFQNDLMVLRRKLLLEKRQRWMREWKNERVGWWSRLSRKIKNVFVGPRSSGEASHGPIKSLTSSSDTESTSFRLHLSFH